MQNQLSLISAHLQEIHAHIFDVERIPLAVAALILVSVVGLVTGPLAGAAVPLFWRIIDLLFGGVGGRLDRSERPPQDLLFRGFIITMTGIALSYLIGRFAAQVSWYVPDWHIAEVLALALTLSAGAVWAALLRLHKAISSDSPAKGAFYAISRTTRTNLTTSDEFTITRVGMGMGIRAFDKAVVAPILWYLIAGLPGAYLYAGLAALAWRFGRDGYTRGFGQTALALEKLMGFVPSLLAGILLALAGVFTPTGRTTRAIAALKPGKGRATYFEGGLPLSAAAFALDVSLGGATQDLDGNALCRGWTGPDGATAQIGAKHLYRGMYLVIVAHILLLASLFGAIVVSGHLGLDF